MQPPPVQEKSQVEPPRHSSAQPPPSQDMSQEEFVSHTPSQDPPLQLVSQFEEPEQEEEGWRYRFREYALP